MTSEPEQAFVWVWLPGATDPVVAGRLDLEGQVLAFTYGRSYLEREDRIPLYLPELPLRRARSRRGRRGGRLHRRRGPDAWGQRVILNRLIGGGAADTAELTPLTYLLESGSDRTGALDFQASAEEYVPRVAGPGDPGGTGRIGRAGRAWRAALTRARPGAAARQLVGGARPEGAAARRRPATDREVQLDHGHLPGGQGRVRRRWSWRGAPASSGAGGADKALGGDALLVERFDRPEGGAAGRWSRR